VAGFDDDGTGGAALEDGTGVAGFDDDGGVAGFGDGTGGAAATGFEVESEGAGRATWGYWLKTLFPRFGVGAGAAWYVDCVDCADVEAAATAGERLLLPATETMGWEPY
jgi:hypothetical protein